MKRFLIQLIAIVAIVGGLTWAGDTFTEPYWNESVNSGSMTISQYRQMIDSESETKLKLDALSEEKSQLDVSIRFNAIPPKKMIQILDELNTLYGIGGSRQQACKLTFTVK